MDETSFNISFPIDFWTRYRASLTLMHRLWGTWMAYAFFVGVPTLAFIAAYVFDWDLSEPGTFNLPGWVLLLGGYVFMFVFMPLLQMIQLWLGSRRNRTLLGTQHQSPTPEGFSASGDTFNTKLKWDAIYKAIKTKHFFFLYMYARAAFFIAKSKISGTSDMDRLRTVLKSCLNDKARLRTTSY